MSDVLITIGIILAALLAFLIISALVLYICCFTRAIKTESLYTEKGIRLGNKRYGLAKWMDTVAPEIEKAKNLPCENVSVKSRDGKTLRGVFYPNGESDTTIILFHGWHSCGENDFGCALTAFLAFGMNVLLVSQRGQAQSDGNLICMGAKEKYDCAVWAEYVEKRFGKDHKVFLEGISMGATTVLLASGMPLPDCVKGIIADCGYTSTPEILKAVAKWKHIPPYPLMWFVAMFFWIFSGCNIYKDSTLDAMKKNTRPVLFVHGEADSFVPCYMSRQNYEACVAPKEILTVKGADHGKSYLVDPEKCTEVIGAFVNKYR